MSETNEAPIQHENKMSDEVRQALQEIIDYARKVQENLISINEHGGGIIYQGFTTRGSQENIRNFLMDSTWTQANFEDKSRIQHLLEELERHNPVQGGYDTAVVDDVLRQSQSLL